MKNCLEMKRSFMKTIVFERDETKLRKSYETIIFETNCSRKRLSWNENDRFEINIIVLKCKRSFRNENCSFDWSFGIKPTNMFVFTSKL